MKKEALIWIICILLLITSISSQTLDYKLEKDAPILEMYLYSWGLGETTEINLDDYFSIKRNSGEVYISSSSSEISISLNQETGIAKLTPNTNWLGTKRIVFMITNENTSSTEAKKKLEEYVKKEITLSKNEDILKQIENNEFKNNTLPFDTISKLLESLRKNLGPEAKVTAAKEEKLVKLDIGKNVKLDVGFEKKIINNLTTEKPKIVVNVNPLGEGTEEVVESGYSWIIILPIIFIILSLISILGFYIKDHFSAQINRFISKFKERNKQIDLEKANYIKIKHSLSEIEKIEKIENVQIASNQFFTIIKEFFKALIKPKFSEAYSGLDKTIMLDSIDEELKNNIITFSKEVYDIKFSGKEIDKKELKKLVSKSKSLIYLVLSKKKKYLIREEKKESWIIKLLEKLKEGKKGIKEIEKKVTKSREEIEKKEKIGIIKILNKKLGLFKTKEEKIKEKIEGIKRKKLKEKIEKEKELKIKEKEKELERLKLKERKEKRENIKRYFKRILHDKLRLYKTEEEKIELKRLESLKKARTVRERQLEEIKKGEENRKKEKDKKQRTLERRKEIKKFLHNKFGLFKTEEEKAEIKRLESLEKARKTREKQLKEEKRKEEKREKASERKRKIRKFLHNYLGLYKNKSEIEKLKKINAIEKAKETREKKEKEKLQKKEEIIRQYEEEKKREEKKQKALEKKKEIRRFLHDKLGLFKTEVELIEEKRIRESEKIKKERERQLEGIKRKEEEEKNAREREKRKEERKIKEEEIKKEFKEKEKKVKKSFKDFIHHKIGLFRTTEEKIEDLKIIRQKRIERLKELKRNFIAEEIENLKAGEELTPEQKVKILEEELRNSLNKGQIERAKKIDKELDRLYPKVQKKKEYKIKPNIFTKLRDKIKEVKFRPEFKEFKEKILHPVKEQKKERVKEEHIKELEKQTQKLLESGNIKKAESFYTRASELLKNTESKIKKIANKEAEEIGGTTKKIEEEIKEKFDKFTSPKEKPKQVPIKDNTHKIEKIISDIKTHVGKDLYKAKELYTKASSEFKKIPEELPETTHQRLYNQLKPLKNEILRQSIPKLMKELKTNLSAGKLEKAKEIKEQIDDIYSYLAKQEGISYTSKLIPLIEKANELIDKKKINEAKELYKEITEKYDSLSQMEKQKYYKMVLDLYNRLIR